MPAISPADTAWMLIATAMVLVMTPALGFFYGGMVRAKNALNTMMMSYVALGFVGILFFTAAFNFGFGSMVWVYASESFPAQLRTLGSSTMLTADLVANVIIASFFLSALTSLGGMVTFIILVVFAVIAWLFVWWLAPETKGRPLEAIRSYWVNGGKWTAE